MKEYKELLQKILVTGTDQFNERTKHVCRAIAGYQFQIDTSVYFPATTLRRLPFKNMKGELLGFFRGYTNAADFRALGCGYWDKNANETQAWLNNFNRKGTDDLGPIYGKQWTAWRDTRIINFSDLDNYSDRYQVLARFMQPDGDKCIIERTINQLENVLHTLITNPTDRRCIVSGWNVSELDMMALPPCHRDYNFIVIDGVLHCVMSIR